LASPPRSCRRATTGVGTAADRAWLLCLASDEVEAAIRGARPAIDRIAPARADEMLRTLAGDPGPLPTGLALIDPRSKRHGWLFRCRIDGRRSRAPYRGYADFIDRSAPWRPTSR
jgi:hypothetical protein